MSKQHEPSEKDTTRPSEGPFLEKTLPTSDLSESASTVVTSDQVETPDGLPRSTLEEDRPVLGMNRADRLFVTCLCLAILILSGVHLVRLSLRGTPAIAVDRSSPQSIPFYIDPNTANWVEWMQLPGIGETTARRIVEDREANGPFLSVDDVRRIKGIGSVTAEKIRPFLQIKETPQHDD